VHFGDPNPAPFEGGQAAPGGFGGEAAPFGGVRSGPAVRTFRTEVTGPFGAAGQKRIRSPRF
jgi:hypothetical protein